MTLRQRNALEQLWPNYGLEVIPNGPPLDLQGLFGNQSPCVFEIGFGMGQSLLEMAQSNPGINFLGVDVHRSGVGALLADIHEAGIDNVRLFCDDAVDVLSHSIPDNSLYRVQIFFPDPWPKRRHHKRRLISETFVRLVASKLVANGRLHLATDWEDYAQSILATLEASPLFRNLAGVEGGFSPKPAYRPATKYEQRGQRLGHVVRDIVFEKCLKI